MTISRATRWLFPGLSATALAALLVLSSLSEEKKEDADAKAPAKERALEGALKQARVNGKYQMLLRQIKVAEDRENYTDFSDYGPYQATEYAGYKDLPAGNWVYVYPYWYIWRDRTADKREKRNWGPEQATGPPDTKEAGDRPTAWASQTPDGQDEWLLLEYATPVVPKAVVVHETFNPGAVYRVTAFRLDGKEVEVWKGKDPTPTDKDQGVSVIPVKTKFKTNRIVIYLNSTKVAGWNEIDAVGLRDARGKTQWAVAADASSTYAQPFAAPGVDAREQRIRKLEKEVRELKQMVKEMKDLLKEKDK
jgi:hypothetical protein